MSFAFGQDPSSEWKLEQLFEKIVKLYKQLPEHIDQSREKHFFKEILDSKEHEAVKREKYNEFKLVAKYTYPRDCWTIWNKIDKAFLEYIREQDKIKRGARSENNSKD